MLDLEKIYKNIANNFELIRKYESLSKHEFSQQLSISSGNYGDVVGEPPRINASLKMIIGLLNAYPTLNINWLFYNQGEMFLSPAAVSKIKEPASQYNSSEWQTLTTTYTHDHQKYLLQLNPINSPKYPIPPLKNTKIPLK